MGKVVQGKYKILFTPVSVLYPDKNPNVAKYIVTLLAYMCVLLQDKYTMLQ